MCENKNKIFIFFINFRFYFKLLGALGVTLDEVGIELDQAEVHQNPLYLKALQILHTAKDDAELSCYIEALKIVQKSSKTFYRK